MLFGPSAPDGLFYRPDLLSADEERELVAQLERLAFTQVEMRGVVARRRTVHYGWTYGYYSRRSEPGPPLPEFLHEVRSRVATWAAIDPESFVEALITEYTPGAAIGWHRDAPMFGDVIGGVSLLATARMKFRPYVSPRAILPAEAGSHKPILPAEAGSHKPILSAEAGSRKPAGQERRTRAPRRTTHELDLLPRSGYLITGVARRDFEHSIPGVDALRYSITFRTLRR
jgi:alkylated DNA repair dioxygenase AlkB